MLFVLAALHLAGDSLIGEPRWMAAVEVPIALAIIPVVYSALQYGLVGSAATSVWAVILWLPDLSLRDGHTFSDLVSLGMVVVVGIFVGFRIESERLTNLRAHRAAADLLASEARHRQLFEANHAPILVADVHGVTTDANPAALDLLGIDLVGRPAAALLHLNGPLTGMAPRVLSLPDGREYRLELVSVPSGGSMQTQIVLEDVTTERSEGRRATRYAALVVQAEEDQRKRLARELHDEPLQLFLHIARRLESIAALAGVPAVAARDLAQARRQSLDAAARLRSLARDLRPPTLDQLGLVAAVSSLVAEVEDDGGLLAELQVVGEQVRLAPEIELGAFRIVQEAARNTVYHAHAKRLRVSIRFDPGELEITVVDDGCGFTPSEPPELASSHLGILGMRERARLLGGGLELRSAPGDGTVVALCVRLGRSSQVPELPPVGAVRPVLLDAGSAGRAPEDGYSQTRAAP
jgi:signal transduction histidine kinase